MAKRKIKKKYKPGSSAQKPIHREKGDTLKQDIQPIFSNLSKREYWVLLAILIVTVIVFIPIFSNEFTNWDDKQYVLDNTLIKDLSWKGLKEIFSTPVVSNYHPFTVLSLALNYAASEFRPTSYFFVNLLLHLVNTFFVFWFIFLLSKKKIEVAVISSLLFAIHPMHVESVAWISERKDVLFMFFMLPGLILYIKYLKNHSYKTLVYIFLLALFSLLSKPAAVVFPVLLLLMDYFYIRKFTSRLIFEKIPFFLLSLVTGIVTIQIQSVKAIATLTQYDIIDRLLFSCYGTMNYISRFFVPHPLSAFHPFPNIQSLPMIYYIAPFFVLALAGFVYYFRKTRFVIFGILFFLVSLLPVIQLLTLGNAIIAERYTYLPYISLTFIVGMFYSNFKSKNSLAHLNYISAVLGIIILTYGYLSFDRTKVWKNSETLWTNVLKTYPDSRRAYMSRAVYYHSNKNYELALKDYNKSLELGPNFIPSFQGRGYLYITTREYEKAIADFNRVLKTEPNNLVVLLNRGTAYTKLKNYENAIVDFNKALSLSPDDPSILNSRGTLYFNVSKDYQKALLDFNLVLSINPNYGTAYLNRSRCYFKMNNMTEARNDMKKAQSLGVVVPDSYLKLMQ